MIDHTDSRAIGTGLLIELTTRYVRIADGAEYHPAFVQTLELDADDIAEAYGDPVEVALGWIPQPVQDHIISGSRLLSTIRLVGSWSPEQRAEFDWRLNGDGSPQVGEPAGDGSVWCKTTEERTRPVDGWCPCGAGDHEFYVWEAADVEALSTTEA
jgi:hypothetical protein